MVCRGHFHRRWFSVRGFFSGKNFTCTWDVGVGVGGKVGNFCKYLSISVSYSIVHITDPDIRDPESYISDLILELNNAI